MPESDPPPAAREPNAVDGTVFWREPPTGSGRGSAGGSASQSAARSGDSAGRATGRTSDRPTDMSVNTGRTFVHVDLRSRSDGSPRRIPFGLEFLIALLLPILIIASFCAVSIVALAMLWVASLALGLSAISLDWRRVSSERWQRWNRKPLLGWLKYADGIVLATCALARVQRPSQLGAILLLVAVGTTLAGLYSMGVFTPLAAG